MGVSEREEERRRLAALRAGDPGAVRWLVDTYGDRLYSLALRLLGDPDEAQDVVQETFIRALDRLDQFREEARFGTWLYRIAYNQALMALRRRRPHLRLDDPVETEEGDVLPRELEDWSQLPEDRLLAGEMRERLEAAIQELSPALRSVFLLRDVHGFSTQETAEVLGISPGAVKVRLHRARMRLRERLSEYLRDFPVTSSPSGHLREGEEG